jgi:hypothetical protein
MYVGDFGRRHVKVYPSTAQVELALCRYQQNLPARIEAQQTSNLQLKICTRLVSMLAGKIMVQRQSSVISNDL